MAYSKRFPKDVKGSPYTAWEEVVLTPEEEKAIEQKQRAANMELMRECIRDARTIFSEEKLSEGVMEIATALFTQRSRHVVYWKEEKAKQKFDEQSS